MLKESELEPLTDLRIKLEQTWEDNDFKIDRNRIKYLDALRVQTQKKMVK